MKVLRIIDLNRLSEITVKNGNQLIIPVNDGNGDLIIGPEVLQDPAFSKVHKILSEITEEIEYVPLDLVKNPEKFTDFANQGKLILTDLTRDIKYGNITIPIKEYSKVPEPTKGLLETAAETARSAWNWVTGLFK